MTMKVFALFLFFIYSFVPAKCDVDKFEFGVNVGRVTFATSGNIGILEKNIRIPIVIPECRKLSYVRVDVDNKIGPPAVSLEEDLHTVVIKYRLLQFSMSSYVVTAKSVPIPKCYRE